MKRFAWTVLVLSACGGDDGGMMTQSDAPTMNTNKVQTVTCPGTADATVMTSTNPDAYVPMMTTVPKNAVVKFVMGPTHDVNPNTTGGKTSDPGLVVGFGETKCLKFTESGAFNFFCSAHSFAGVITVQ